MVSEISEGEPFTQWRRVLIAADYSELGELALAQGLTIASTSPSTVAHVIYVQAGVAPSPAMAPGDVAPVVVPMPSTDEAAMKVRERVERAKAKLATHCERGGFSETVVHVRRGPPANVITELADELDVDLIVVGTHGKTGLQRMVLGSVSEKIVRTAPCAVLVVRPKASGVAES